MKNFLLINLSPRQKGTSVTLLNLCEKYLRDRGHNTQALHLYPNLRDLGKVREAVLCADALMLSGPCYINTYPADTTALLLDWAEHNEILHGQDLYGMIQGGMPYAHTHACGLNMLEQFGRRCNVQYKGGFAMGLGAMLNGQPIEKLPHAKRVNRQLEIFFGHIEKGEVSPKEVYEEAQLRLPKFAFRFLAGIANRAIDKDLRAHSMNATKAGAHF